MNQKENEIIERSRQAGRSAFYNVEPRYSAGSPALVSLGEAAKLAVEEVQFHELHLSGVFGHTHRTRAEQLGLSGIVYARWEAKGKVWRLDLITGERFMEPKRLSWDEQDRVLMLRNRKQYVGLDRDSQFELDELERRARLHRQEVRPQ